MALPCLRAGAAKSRAKGIRVTLVSEIQARQYHLQGHFPKGEPHFRGAERSVVNFFKKFLFVLLLQLTVDSLPMTGQLPVHCGITFLTGCVCCFVLVSNF